MPETTLIVDGHSHLYREATVPQALNAAESNFSAALRRAGRTAGYGMLMLADPSDLPGFEWVCAGCQGENGWRAVSRPDASVIHLEKPGALSLAVLAGRQIITAENLELLVFPRPAPAGERLPLADLLEAVTDAGHLAILPWGVGKWVGHRGGVIRRILGSTRRKALAVGDNGGRPRIWARVGLLEHADTLGYPDIAGSDPLPIAGDTQRIGSYGVMTRASVDPDCDTAFFLRLLQESQWLRYGRRPGLPRFAQAQARLRWGKAERLGAVSHR